MFRDDQGRTLYDLPDAPRPSEFVGAPVRFLPEYDNLFFGYADRTRFVPDLRKPPIPPGNGARTGTVFVDGEWRATWKIALPVRRARAASAKAGATAEEPADPAAVLTVTLFGQTGAQDEAAIERRGRRPRALHRGAGRARRAGASRNAGGRGLTAAAEAAADARRGSGTPSGVPDPPRWITSRSGAPR